MYVLLIFFHPSYRVHGVFKMHRLFAQCWRFLSVTFFFINFYTWLRKITCTNRNFYITYHLYVGYTDIRVCTDKYDRTCYYANRIRELRRIWPRTITLFWTHLNHAEQELEHFFFCLRICENITNIDWFPSISVSIILPAFMRSFEMQFISTFFPHFFFPFTVPFWTDEREEMEGFLEEERDPCFRCWKLLTFFSNFHRIERNWKAELKNYFFSQAQFWLFLSLSLLLLLLITLLLPFRFFIERHREVWAWPQK